MKKIFVIAIGLMMTACAPYLDARKEAGRISTIGQSKVGFPAVCYHPLWHNMEKVQQIAQAECQKLNKTAVLKDKKYFSCSLITPSTAFYECQK